MGLRQKTWTRKHSSRVRTARLPTVCVVVTASRCPYQEGWVSQVSCHGVGGYTHPSPALWYTCPHPHNWVFVVTELFVNSIHLNLPKTHTSQCTPQLPYKYFAKWAMRRLFRWFLTYRSRPTRPLVLVDIVDLDLDSSHFMSQLSVPGQISTSLKPGSFYLSSVKHEPSILTMKCDGQKKKNMIKKFC